ncbi:tRNA (N(6)-L-threonylcarbamoyladenosine(37)-C(2))-methylthiotransferase MtaB [soil metagenome]
MSKTVALHTLGCKLNYSETSAIARHMEDAGFVQKPFSESADVYVINTCSVTENADKECRQLVRRIQRKAPAAMVVITGCYAQLKPEEIASIEGVDLVLGAAEKFNIISHLSELTKGDATRICSCDIDDVNEFHASFSLNGRTRTFLKVQDGCSYNCSFCTIPMARGKSRSNSIDKVLEDVALIAATGVQEIVLTGINLGDYKTSSTVNESQNFFDLIQQLETTDIPRYRISSIEPNLLTNDIIEFVANSNKFMPHFHIPLQSGSNKILGLMRRRYRKELYVERIEFIKKLMPHCAIGVDVIVGFPGETEEDFLETCNFLTESDISYLHVFTYSERDHTHALTIRPVVPVEIRNQRNKILRNLSYQKMQHFTYRHIGQTRKVLFETETKSGMMEGYSDNYIKVTIPFSKEKVNTICDHTI